MLHCGEFVGYRGRLLGMIEGTEEWMAEWRNRGDEGGVGLLLGRLVAGVKEMLLVRKDKIIMGNVLKGGNTNVWHLGPCLWHPHPPPSPLPPRVPWFLSPPNNS